MKNKFGWSASIEVLACDILDAGRYPTSALDQDTPISHRKHQLDMFSSVKSG